MNKNLKKVISAVSALALSASSVAAFAVSYPDVPETATYKQAVTELSALNIINGFEDGTFGPDQNVTRAQITKMIVTALGKTAVAAAEANAGKDTQFADVTGNHWAAGFVATGTSATASNFINGYSDTAFGPEDNVTYAQAIKMLVAALGYSSYAENEGGWPNGYLKYGYSLGLTKGVSGLGNDDAATRAQVAQMIDNALKCPLCMSNGYESDAWGRLVPKTVIKDGSGDLDGTKDGYQNLLNYAHDAYLVYGRVTATFKTGDCEADEVKFKVEKSDNWKGYSVPRVEDVEELPVYKGDVTDADDYLFAYSEAILAEDENEEYTLVSLTQYGATESVEIETDLFKAYDSEGNNYDSLQVWKDSTKSGSKYNTYRLNKDLVVYINGVDSSESIDVVWDEDEEDVAAAYAGGTITLVDSSDEGKSATDGRYDYAMITRYTNAIVDEVVVGTDEATIYFLDSTEDFKLKVELDDEEKDYNFTLNGEAIEVADLLQDDVLTIAHNGDSLEAATSYDIMVSRDTVEAKLRGIDEIAKEYTFDNGETYKVASSDLSEIDLAGGESYVLHLNVFGKIAMTRSLASSKKFAILENVYSTNGDSDYAATIITSEGKTSYLLDDREAANELTAVLMGIKDADFTDKDLDNKADVSERVIEYSIKSTGELNFKNNVKYEDKFEKDYKASTSKLGSVKVSEAITTIIDVQEYLDEGDAVAMSYADLVDGTTYTGYAYGEAGSDNAAQFILITAGTAGLNVNSDMAVFVSKSAISSDDLGDTTAVYALVAGEEVELILDTEDLAEDLVAGDAFFFKKNSEGYVTDIYSVLADSIDNKYGALWAKALDDNFDLVNADVAAGFKGEEGAKVHFNRAKNVDECELVFGAIVEATSGNVGIITNAADLKNVDITNPADYNVADDVVVTLYDYSVGGSAKYRVEKATTAVVKASRFDREARQDKDGEIIDFTSEALTGGENSNYGYANLALLKVVDDEVTEIVVYVPSSDSKD